MNSREYVQEIANRIGAKSFFLNDWYGSNIKFKFDNNVVKLIKKKLVRRAMEGYPTELEERISRIIKEVKAVNRKVARKTCDMPDIVQETLNKYLEYFGILPEVEYDVKKDCYNFHIEANDTFFSELSLSLTRAMHILDDWENRAARLAKLGDLDELLKKYNAKLGINYYEELTIKFPAEIGGSDRVQTIMQMMKFIDLIEGIGGTPISFFDKTFLYKGKTCRLNGCAENLSNLFNMVDCKIVVNEEVWNNYLEKLNEALDSYEDIESEAERLKNLKEIYENEINAINGKYAKIKYMKKFFK